MMPKWVERMRASAWDRKVRKMQRGRIWGAKAIKVTSR